MAVYRNYCVVHVNIVLVRPLPPSAIHFTGAIFWKSGVVASVVARTKSIGNYTPSHVQRAPKPDEVNKQKMIWLLFPNTSASRPIRPLQTASAEMSKDDWKSRNIWEPFSLRLNEPCTLHGVGRRKFCCTSLGPSQVLHCTAPRSEFSLKFLAS